MALGGVDLIDLATVLAGPEATRVRRLVEPVTGVESSTVLDDSLVTAVPGGAVPGPSRCGGGALAEHGAGLRVLVGAVVEWLELRGRVWDDAGIEDVATFARWLRAPADKVIVLDASAVRGRRRRSTGIWRG